MTNAPKDFKQKYFQKNPLFHRNAIYQKHQLTGTMFRNCDLNEIVYITVVSQNSF